MKLDVGMLTHDLKTIPEFARKVEALGFDCLWSAETQHDPFLPLAVAATVDQPHPTRDLHRGRVPPQPHGPGPHLVGPGQGLGRTLHPGAGLAGEGPQRAPLLGEVGGAGAAHARGRAGAARDLGLLAERDQAELQGAVLPVRSHDAVLQPGPHRASPRAGLRRGREPAMCRIAGEVCDGLHVHPFNSPKYLRELVQPAVNEGLAKSGRSARATSPTRRELRGRGRHRGRAGEGSVRR